MSEKSSTFAPVFEGGLNRTNVPRESRIGSLRGQHGGNTWSLPAQSFLRGTLKCTICSTKHIKIHLSGDFFVYVKKKQYFCTMKRILYRHILLLFAVAACVSCCRHSGGKLSLRQAQQVVAQADSLWHEGQMYGIDAGDSATLAQAYETLNSFVHCTSSLCTSFAHACYHYGRLLRAKENPVEAMQAFIAATHSRTRDYHILGRVYSNMGDICHLAGEFQLSYDMFERSGDMYLRNEDTLLYYYDLNNMAYELAEQRKKEETLAMLFRIAKTCTDNDVLDKLLETKARLYLNCKQYDSTLCYAKQLLMKDTCYSSAILLAAQAYSFAGNGDSASLYAKMVLALSNKLYETNNALYILTQDDKTKDIDGVRKASAKRADSQKLIEKHRSKVSQAVQLLEQDLECAPNFQWLYTMIVIVVITGICLGIYVSHKRKKKELLEQKIDILEQAACTVQEKHDALKQSYLSEHKRIIEEINNRCSMLRTNESIKKTLAWRNYAKMCHVVDKQFYLLASKLCNVYSLKDTEVRICILTLLECGNDQMAELLYKSHNSIGTLKRRVANKLGTTSREMRNYLIDNVCLK